MTELRNKLIDLGVDTLADLLLDLATHIDEVDASLRHIVATPNEKLKKIRARLSGLKRSNRYMDWREAPGFARKLEKILSDLEQSVDDGEMGVELVAQFFECDEVIFASCDDSSGMIGDVFRIDACELFAKFAEQWQDKTALEDRIIILLSCNEYGARDDILEKAGDYLPEENLRNIAERFWKLAVDEPGKCQRSSWYRCVEELAYHLLDAPLFEKARVASWGEPGTAACLDIAEIYLMVGEPQIALDWIEKDKAPGTFQKSKRELLLQNIYTELGDKGKAIEIAWKRFSAYRSIEQLDELLAVIGLDQKQAVISEQASEILSSTLFDDSNAMFLIKTGCFDQAEEYLLQSVDQFNGDLYYSMPPLAEAMEKHEYPLAASMLYRSLLDSILRRGYTKSYRHGVRYLKKLDKLASSINDWQKLPDHLTYKNTIRTQHGRKYSFWEKYDV